MSLASLGRIGPPVFLQLSNDVRRQRAHAAIIALDGTKGLLFVLDRIGRHMRDNSEHWQDAFLLDQAERTLGSGVREAVHEEAKRNTNIQRYIDGVEEHQRRSHRRQTPDYHQFSYAELRDRIICDPAKVPRGWPRGWGKRASEDSVRQAAAHLLKETNEQVLIPYVRIFHFRPFPLDPSRLVEFASSQNADLATAARRALRHIEGESVRTLALKLIADGRADNDVARLFVKNYAAGDHVLLKSLLEKQTDEDDFHWMAHALVDVFAVNRNADAMPSMLRIYETARCSLCRKGAVKVLMERGESPAWMLAECKHDSNFSTRQMVSTTV